MRISAHIRCMAIIKINDFTMKLNANVMTSTALLTTPLD